MITIYPNWSTWQWNNVQQEISSMKLCKPLWTNSVIHNIFSVKNINLFCVWVKFLPFLKPSSISKNTAILTNIKKCLLIAVTRYYVRVYYARQYFHHETDIKWPMLVKFSGYIYKIYIPSEYHFIQSVFIWNSVRFYYWGLLFIL